MADDLLRIVLGRMLNPGGIAYSQSRAYRHGYRFKAEAYLGSELKLGDPEMRSILPQHMVLRIAHEAGCRVLK